MSRFPLLAVAILVLLYSTENARAQAQDIRFEHFTVADGLPANSVRSIVQDHQGFLWFSTGLHKLSKYDGHDFTYYEHDPSDSLSLGAGQIRILFIDVAGALWVGMSESGLHRFDQATETFTHFSHDPENSNSISATGVAGIRGDATGMLWLLTTPGYAVVDPKFMDRLDPSTGIVTRFRHDANDPTSISIGNPRWLGYANAFMTFEVGLDGIIWIGNLRGGLNQFEPETNTFIHYVHDENDPSSLSDYSVLDVLEDRTGRLWVGTEKGLNLLNRTDGTFTHFVHEKPNPDPENLDRIRKIHEDRDGNLWIATLGGLSSFDPDSGTFKDYNHGADDPNRPGNFPLLPFVEDLDGDFWFFTNDIDRNSPFVINHFDRSEERLSYFRPDVNNPNAPIVGGRPEEIFVDRSGVVWIGTWGGGLNKYDRSSQKFRVMQHDANNPNSLSGNIVDAIHESTDGSLWVGARPGGLNKLDPTRTRFTHFRNDPTNPLSLSSDELWTIVEDRKGDIWVGTRGAGLNKLDRTSGQFTHYQHNPDDSTSLSDPTVYALYVDRSDNLWVGAKGNGSITQTGFQYLDPASNTFLHYNRMPFSTQDMAVYDLDEDNEGNIWIGSNLGGLQRFDRETNTVKSFQSKFLSSGGSIISLIWSESGHIWAGSLTGGLGRFDPRTETEISYTTKDGLPNNLVLCVSEDESGNIWSGTGNGLSKFDTSSSTFRNYDESDGLPSAEFVGGSTYRGADGTLYFGTRNGLVAFHPDDIADNPYMPEVAFTKFSLFNQTVEIGADSPLSHHISLTKSITLRHDENDFSFGYAALHFSSPEKNQYAYKLSPYDDTWREVGTRRIATYMNLDPGTYTFQVKASNNDGLWNEEGASIQITILPPWWLTSWAFVLYGLLGLSVVIGVDRTQRRRISRKERQRAEIRVVELKAEAAESHARVLEELDQTKSRFFANISHEFRTPLTLILGPIRDLITGTFGEITEPVHRQHKLVKRNADRLLNLINQLLDLSNLEAGGMTIRATRADIVPLIRRIAGSFSSRAERQHIQFTFEPFATEVEMYFDEEKLEKIITNLLSNAFKFTPEGGTIGVSIQRADNDGVVISVIDSGEGIAAEELPFIFDRFYQVDSSSTRKHQGTGIGLALVQELVVLHGGSIHVESSPGAGALFTVRLPLGKAHLDESELTDELVRSDSDAYPDTDDQGALEDSDVIAMLDGPFSKPAPDAPLVLVVEDNLDVQAYLVEQLLSRYQVDVASNGVEGLEKIRSRQPALVISDVMMPEMDGYELCRVIKSDSTLNHIPVILLTAKADEESKVEGLETGADDYIYKPFSSAELLVRTENLIEIRRLLRERFSGEVVLQPSQLAVPSDEAGFLEQVRELVDKHMADSNFGVDWLAAELGVSTRQLQRRLKNSLHLSPSGYIRTMRLQRAAQLLDGGIGNVSEVAYAVGLRDAKHFSKLFQQVFGVVPSKYEAKTG